MLREFTDKCGKKRTGIVVNCSVCNKEFVKRQGKSYENKGKYCSTDCRSKARRNRVDVICSWCNKKCSRTQSDLKLSKSGLYFCNRECKEKAQKLGGIKEIMPSHYGTGTPGYREQFLEKEFICSRCGYSEFSCAVDIHHIDHDRSNNDKSNLIPLCSNCHKSLHYGKWELDCPKV